MLESAVFSTACKFASSSSMLESTVFDGNWDLKDSISLSNACNSGTSPEGNPSSAKILFFSSIKFCIFAFTMSLERLGSTLVGRSGLSTPM